MALTGSTIASTYLKLLRANSDTMGADATASYIQDSADTDSALSISTTRVGIGTASPDYGLEVADGGAGGVLRAVSIKSTAASSTSGGGVLLFASDDGAVMADTHRLGSIEFYGAEDTSNTLTVGASITAVTEATWSDSDNASALTFLTCAGDNNSAEKMRINKDGNVGIGTDSPSSELEVYKDDDGVAIGPVLSVTRHSDSPAAADIIGSIDFKGRGNDSALHTYARINSVIQYANNPNEGGELHFAVLTNDTITPSMMINTDGNVGIGTASPTTEVGASTVLEVSAASGTAAIGLNYNTGSSRWEIESDAGDDLTISRNGTSRLLIDGSTADISVQGGDLIFGTAGKGICLGVTSNTDSNTLDDYEEGTWTPEDTDGGGSAQYGMYTKIGNLVTCYFHFTTGAISGGSTFYITNLPFTCGATDAFRGAVSIAYTNATNMPLAGSVGNGSTAAYLMIGTGDIATDDEIGSSKAVTGSIIYRV